MTVIVFGWTWIASCHASLVAKGMFAKTDGGERTRSVIARREPAGEWRGNPWWWRTWIAALWLAKTEARDTKNPATEPWGFCVVGVYFL